MRSFQARRRESRKPRRRPAPPSFWTSHAPSADWHASASMHLATVVLVAAIKSKWAADASQLLEEFQDSRALVVIAGDSGEQVGAGHRIGNSIDFPGWTTSAGAWMVRSQGTSSHVTIPSQRRPSHSLRMRARPNLDRQSYTGPPRRQQSFRAGFARLLSITEAEMAFRRSHLGLGGV
ncbi:uncharacterized protein BDZ99DRAFT_527762 [Mytilinidion resinicola]|uniref:Uncharacterized protein n=1 Tax=Mytilinidion resinicola TaxID=574789 RepID=A0A6A6Y0B2_9PEZI|nr:uncharacterized protein BDZ99DRAFT_527762 [Mytilinidion resinicola]KAF2802090.1 hypothetical protein BDZ99DRAFT_527762 [Mytilinidion resinicola]